MSTIKIRPITLHDLKALQKIGKETFADTFSLDDNEADMQLYLEQSFAKEKLEAELTDPNSEFYFALSNKHIVGYLKVNFGQSQTEIQDNNTFEIERIYVIKEFHGKKVGQVLYNKALDIATQRKVDYVWLGVWEENPRAIRFYEKNGFKQFDTHVFQLGDDKQTDIMMKLELTT